MATGGTFRSLMVVGRDENYAVCGTVVVGVAGRGLDADDLGTAVVCRRVLQCGPVFILLRFESRLHSPLLEGGPIQTSLLRR